MSTPRMTSRRSTLHDLPQYNRDVEIEFYQYTHLFEPQYPFWWNIRLIIDGFNGLVENTFWNCYICFIVLVAVLIATVNLNDFWLHLGYNIFYAIHMLAIAYNAYANKETHAVSWRKVVGLVVDLLSFSHYIYRSDGYRFTCYYIRLHRPFQYLWTLTNYNLKGSVIGTTLKYCYIFIVLRVTWAIFWLMIDEVEHISTFRRSMDRVQQAADWSSNSPTLFLSALYIVNKMFIPIGPSVTPHTDVERVTCMLVMVTGCLVVAGSAVASMSLIISLYMRPEETFRARYRLIIKEMKETHVPQSQRDKVETFYKMYWHKQKAVSSTELLPTFPPTLSATIQCDIYFEATQKSRMLRDLTYEFLSEVAKKMETKRFIPGDAIIKRSSKKTSTIYITYGDIEMVTAEDDATAILRMSRGTILTPCGACAPAGFGQAHVEVRAATFCLAHVLEAKDLWKVAVKYGKDSEQSSTIYDTFVTHMDKVQRHYNTKAHETVKHRSSILHFKKCLMALKEARDANGDLLLAKTDVFLEVAGCYIMRNRADSSLTDESDAICLRPTFPCILQPDSSLQIAWNLFVAGLIVTVCFVHPYYLVFMKTIPIDFRFFDYAVTVVYAIDLLVFLSTGANVEEGVPITFAMTSSQQMRSYWFVLDVLATLPIFEFIGTGHFAGINKLLRLHKVFRVLKGFEDMCVYRSNVLRFLSYSLLLFIACYLMAALQQGFMCFHFGYCQVTNFTHSPYWEQKPLDEETVEHRVTFGLYWAISMIMFTTHMESWGTSNWYNVLYTMFVLEMCVVLRIFMEAVYSATIMVTTSLREDYDATISIVKSCFIKNEVDPVLRQRFITYLQLCWYTDKAYSMTNKRSIFFDLPAHVYQEIVARQRVKYLLTIPFMKFLSNEDLKAVASHARLFYTSPNEILINTGDISNEIYVIAKGICEILSPDTKEQVALLHEKCHFGVFACIFRVPAFYTIRAMTHVQVFSVSLKSLAHPLKDRRLKEIINYIKKQPEFPTVTVPRDPFISYVPPDRTPNTERFRLPKKHEMDYAFLQPFYRLGFLSVLRYIFPRFTIRPDGPYLIRYEWFRSACALAAAMVYPSYTYLSIERRALYYMAWFLDIAAYVDIVQRMLIGYFNEEGILVYHPASTAAHYVRGALIVDLIGCLPWEDLQGYRKEGKRYIVTSTRQFLMMFRLVQLYRLQSIMLVLDDYFERKDAFLVIRAIPLFMVMVNVMTSFIVFYSTQIYFTTDLKSFEIVPKNDVGGSWLNLFSNQFRFNMTDSLWNLHLASYFWVVYETTTTGYNCFNPSNFRIMRLLFIGMLTSAMITTYFSVRIISVRANVNKALAEFQEHMKDMIIWMKKENLDHDLQRDVFEHYEYTWDKMGGVDYNSVFKLCDQITLRTDTILHIYGPIFSKCPILSTVEVSVLRMLGRASHSMHFLRGMPIIDFDDVTSDVYFVDSGGIQARYTHEDVSVIDTLLRGSMFGNLESESTILCPVSFVSTSRVHLLRINSKTFLKIINEFPDVLELMKQHKDPRRPHYIKGGEPGGGIRPWRERSLSAPIVMRSRRNFIRYIYFKDNALQTYLILVSLLCIYLDVYNVGFQNNSIGMIIALYVLDVAFYLKMVLYLIMPLIGGQAQTKEILLQKRKQYMKGDFKYDVISCVPLELFCFFGGDDMLMLFSWFRLNRLFRIVTVYTCLIRYREQITVNLGLVTIWAVTIWFTLSVHTISCIWYHIGILNEQNEPGSSWIYKDDGTSWCQNTYICSLYFVLTTFTQNGVGDIMPKKQSEVIFVSILQMISTMVCMIYVGEFSNIIQYKSFRSFSFYSKYLELQEFLKNNRVSRNIVAQVNRYSLHLWRESRGFQSPHFLQAAPQALRLTVMTDAYMRHIRLHYIFKECEAAFQRQLVGCFQVYTYDENMFVVKACEITDSMYFIHRGKVTDLSDELDFKATVYAVGTSFGLAQGLKHNVPFTESFKTLTKSQVLTLRLDDWLALLKHFPKSAAIIASHRYGGTDGGGQGAHPGHGGSEGQPHLRRNKPRITELMDRGTQPSPPNSSSDTSSMSPGGGAPGGGSGPDDGGAPDGGGAAGVARFVPPPGPSRQKLGPVNITDRWPTDSRHRDTYPAEKDATAETKLAETEMDVSSSLAGTSRWPTDSRRRDISIQNRPYPSEKDATAETELAETELAEMEPVASSPLADTSRWPTDSRRDNSFSAKKDTTAKTKLGKTELNAPSPLDSTSRWPTDSRRDSSYSAEKDATTETELAETKLDAPSPSASTSNLPSDSRRKSLFYPIKKDATAKTDLGKMELDALSPRASTSRWPTDSRRGSSYSAEKDATAETELVEMKLDAPSPSASTSNLPSDSRRKSLFYPIKKDATAKTDLGKMELDAPSPRASTNRWPTDSRRGSSYSAAKDATAETELAETKLDAPSPSASTSNLPSDSRRKSLFYPIKKDATAKTDLGKMELDAPSPRASTSRWPTDSRRDSSNSAEKDATAETELAETKLDAPSPPAGTSHLPSDSRRRKSLFYPTEKDTTAKTELGKTELDAPSPRASTSRWPIDSRRRDTSIHNRPYPSEEDATGTETELAETKLGAASPLTGTSRWQIDSRRRDTPYPGKKDATATKLGMASPTVRIDAEGTHSLGSGVQPPPNTSSSDPSTFGSADVSARSKSSFLDRVANAMKKLVPTRSGGGSGDIRFSTSEESERWRSLRQSDGGVRHSEDNPDEEYIARLEHDLGRLSQSSNTSMERLMATVGPESRMDITQEKVEIATAPDDADWLAEPATAVSARDKAISAARLKRKSVRVRYEDDITDMVGKAVGDSDESDLTPAEKHSPPSTDDDPANTSEKDSSGSSSYTNTNKKQKK